VLDLVFQRERRETRASAGRRREGVHEEQVAVRSQGRGHHPEQRVDARRGYVAEEESDDHRVVLPARIPT
jgi:hypothetical protein